MSVAALLLAAGASRRLGCPKQLLRHQGETLVHRAARLALEARCAPVIVALGASREETAAALSRLPVELRVNPDWEEGIASSIRCGVAAACALEPAPSALLVLLTDQIALDAALLARLLASHHASPALRVACEYSGGVGVPALFPRSDWDLLLALRGDRGAKSLLESDPERLIRVPFAAGARDVDDPDAREELEAAAGRGGEDVR